MALKMHLILSLPEGQSRRTHDVRFSQGFGRSGEVFDGFLRGFRGFSRKPSASANRKCAGDVRCLSGGATAKIGFLRQKPGFRAPALWRREREALRRRAAIWAGVAMVFPSTLPA
jgi:hypothetical protein